MDLLAQSPILRLLILGLLFGATVWALFTVLVYLQRSERARRQLRSLTAGALGSQETISLSKRNRNAWARIVETIEASGLDLTDSKPDALRAKLVAAGFEAPEAPRLYTLLRLVLVFLLPAVAIIAVVAGGSELSIGKLYVIGTVSGVVALFGPAWIVRLRASSRRQTVTNGFPNCLDLMLVCVEAGLGMEAALERIGVEMADAEPLVSKYLIETTMHLRAGASREEALRRLGDSAGVEEVRSFCTLLIQSDKLGTSIATTLRVYAGEMRERRKMRAEEKAHRLPVLISIPLILCMLPTMVGVLMLPALIRVVRQLLPAMTGG